MEKLHCKACACYSMVPMEVQVKGDHDPPLSGMQESLFYTCHVCGDNWLSIKETADYGESQITFIHQMGMPPLLKRVARLEGNDEILKLDAGHWSYYIGEDEIPEGLWKEKLQSRRQVLKSICSN